MVSWSCHEYSVSQSHYCSCWHVSPLLRLTPTPVDIILIPKRSPSRTGPHRGRPHAVRSLLLPRSRSLPRHAAELRKSCRWQRSRKGLPVAHRHRWHRCTTLEKPGPDLGGSRATWFDRLESVKEVVFRHKDPGIQWIEIVVERKILSGLRLENRPVYPTSALKRGSPYTNKAHPYLDHPRPGCPVWRSRRAQQGKV